MYQLHQRDVLNFSYYLNNAQQIQKQIKTDIKTDTKRTALRELLTGLWVQLIAVNKIVSNDPICYVFVATNSIQRDLYNFTLYF